MSGFLSGRTVISSVGTTELVDLAVTTSKIAASAVTAEKTSGLPVDKDIRAMAL